jgi:hypothetical protein
MVMMHLEAFKACKGYGMDSHKFESKIGRYVGLD